MAAPHKKTAPAKKTPHSHSPQTYQGKAIVTIRDAITGDPGFNGTDGEQAIVRFEDGSEMTVPYSELDE